jgi:MFS family permease
MWWWQIKNFDILCVMSVGFFVMFCASNVAQSLATTMLEESEYADYAFLSLSLLYLWFMISGFIFAPTLVKRWGAKFSIIFASIQYALYSFVFALPALRAETIKSGGNLDVWYLNDTFVLFCVLLAPCLNGIAAGIIWVAQGNLISEAASESNKGFFNGFFTFWF